MIVRWIVSGASLWCFLVGVWRHDWILMGASLALIVLFALIAEEVRDDV